MFVPFVNLDENSTSTTIGQAAPENPKVTGVLPYLDRSLVRMSFKVGSWKTADLV